MNKLLRFPLVAFILLFSVFASAQDSSVYLVNDYGSNTGLINNVLSHMVEKDQSVVEDFSYNENTVFFLSHTDHKEHDAHEHEISLIDIISSDEGADFNCSGGFCLNRSHFHKKGLTLNRQFFDYFVSIDC